MMHSIKNKITIMKKKIQHKNMETLRNELLTEINHIEGRIISLHDTDQETIVSYILKDEDTIITITGPSMQAITKAMFFSRLRGYYMSKLKISKISNTINPLQ